MDLTMNIREHSKYLLAGLVIAMMLLVLHLKPETDPVPLGYIPLQAVQRGPSRHLMALMHKAQSAETSAVAPLIRKRAMTEEELRELGLRSLMRHFTYVYNGKVLCGQVPCPADLELVIDTTHHPDTHLHAQTQPDGSYSIQVSMLEDPHDQIDWRLTARGCDWSTDEMHGRHILEDDPNITITNSLHLQ